MSAGGYINCRLYQRLTKLCKYELNLLRKTAMESEYETTRKVRDTKQVVLNGEWGTLNYPTHQLGYMTTHREQKGHGIGSTLQDFTFASR